MRTNSAQSFVALMIVAGFVACGGGGAGSSATTTPSNNGTGTTVSSRAVGFDVPSEISAVAPKSGSTPIARIGAKAGLFSVVAATAATDPGTDYSNATTTRFVAEHSVNQFAIIQTILNAMAQTHYADQANINAGPYKSIVSWQENDKGSQSKTTQTWTVDSAMIVEGGKDVNRVRCWIEDEGRIIKAEFKIYASATKRADGSYQDYGVWTLNAKLDDAGTSYFAAKASVGPNGEALVSINEAEAHGGPVETMRASMSKSDVSGFGKVSFPEWNGGQAPVQTTLAYVYNTDQLRIKDANQDTYKDRASTVEITDRYGMFDAITGADVMKSHSFGFPVSFSINGTPGSGYYGAWQGRHQLWAGQGGGALPDGTVVTRQDRGNVVESYKTASFTGTLTKRTLVAADVNDLLNLPVETWVNSHHDLTWNGSQWMENNAAFTDYASLVAQPRKFVGIHGWDSVHQQPKEYVYQANAGFFEATRDPNTGQVTSTGVAYSPSFQDHLWVDIGGSIYIQYNGPSNGWVQKTLTSFNEQTWTPSFDPSGDHPFTLELGHQYYINKQGGNYVVTRTDVAAYDVRIELQAAANPVNASTLLSGVATFRPQNYSVSNPGQTSTYRFDVTPSSPTFLQLVYASVGTQDANLSPAPQVGAVVANGQWGLVGYDQAGNSTGVQFNWDYPRQGDNWNGQTYLYTEDNLGNRTYKLLDDPIQLQNLVLTVNSQPKTFSLQFDGWMHGLPEYFQELSQNGWIITDEVASKIVNIPEGTAVTSALDPSQHFLVKPLEVGLYLKVAAVPDASLDITAAQGINLSDPNVIPTFVDPGMGNVPTGTVTKYSEGNPVH